MHGQILYMQYAMGAQVIELLELPRVVKLEIKINNFDKSP